MIDSVNNITSLSSHSSVSEQLAYNETSEYGSVGYFQEDFGGYCLEGRVLFNQNKDWPTTLFVHGARSDYTEMNALLFALQKQGISTLSFNLSGHNKTSGISLFATSLQNNLEECQRFFSRLAKSNNYTVIGHSLGGALAGKLTSLNLDTVANLVLFCPAVYADNAYAAHFGSEFTKAISPPLSFLDSTGLIFLKTFKGNVSLIMGEFDGLNSAAYGKAPGTSAGTIELNGQTYYSPIPLEVVEGIKNNVPKNQMHYFCIPQCDHQLASWLRSNPKLAQNLVEKIWQDY